MSDEPGPGCEEPGSAPGEPGGISGTQKCLRQTEPINKELELVFKGLELTTRNLNQFLRSMNLRNVRNPDLPLEPRHVTEKDLDVFKKEGRVSSDPGLLFQKFKPVVEEYRALRNPGFSLRDLLCL